MKIIKGLLASTGILSTLMLSNPAQAQKQTNTASSCYEQTTSGVVNKGKCIIRSKVDGKYIYIKVEKSWGEADYFRLTNSSNCKTWRMKSISDMGDGCTVEQKDKVNGWGEGVIRFITGKDDNGNESVIYTHGRGYGLHYQGAFKRPYVDSSTPKKVQKQTNTVSTCYVTSHQEILNKGKCIVRSRLQGNNIFVTIEKSWGETNYFRLTNPYCNDWGGAYEGCSAVESKNGSDWVNVTPVSFGRDVNTGSPNLFYESQGGFHRFFYQGQFKKPFQKQFADPCEGIDDMTC
ncbi:MAG: hypothetical protein SWZ49_04110 [Cyanobacteriota bacterium]|nr:hypothetical protein [Cyanobacteriota bacterium]